MQKIITLVSLCLALNLLAGCAPAKEEMREDCVELRDPEVTIALIFGDRGKPLCPQLANQELGMCVYCKVWRDIGGDAPPLSFSTEYQETSRFGEAVSSWHYNRTSFEAKYGFDGEECRPCAGRPRPR